MNQWIEQHSSESPKPVYVIAMGKAAHKMFSGASAALKSHGLELSAGIVVGAGPIAHNSLPERQSPERQPSEPQSPLESWDSPVRVVQGDHPIPGPNSLAAAEALEDFIQSIDAGARVLVLISGGTTSLCAAPLPELSLSTGSADAAQALIANLAETLLESGMAIHEMNTIRRRVLRFGAGRLAVALASRGVSSITAFAVSDVIGDDAAVIGSGPVTPDHIDDESFLAMLDAWNLRPILQREMADVLGLTGKRGPAPVPEADHPAFAITTYSILARNADAIEAMASAAKIFGIDSVFPNYTPLEGEARSLGELIVQRTLTLARSLNTNQSPLFIFGGEPVVHLRETMEHAWQADDEDDALLTIPPAPLVSNRAAIADEPLLGGRMQVLALSAALALEQAASRGEPNASRITVLAAGTDGRDGPTDAAGAIVDAAVPALARRSRRKPESDLVTGRSWYSLNAAQALLRTGPTGTNVMDIVAVLVQS